MDKVKIEEVLAKGLSLRKAASELGVSLAKLYYYIEKHQIPTRSKSEAQKAFVSAGGHQRKGIKHSAKTKDKISAKMSQFWDGSQGEAQKERMVKQRRAEWDSKDKKQRSQKLQQLKTAPRPRAGQLSKFGQSLSLFFSSKGFETSVCQKLVLNHLSDIILTKDKFVIELIPPIYVFGKEAEEKLFETYDKIKLELHKSGYKLLIIEQVSNGLSKSRCQKVLDQVQKMIGENINYKVIQS